jgi:uncharacterized phage protein (TIGR01671 family)
MRPFKIKAWDIENHRMIQWDELLRSPDLLRSVLCNESYMTNPPKPLWILLQFTGLHDKNGKEIWEGDIVLYPEVVPSRLEKFEGYDVKPAMKSVVEIPNFYLVGGTKERDTNDIEVLGNIYETPELVK